MTSWAPQIVFIDCSSMCITTLTTTTILISELFNL
jgi:hypothetical protein